MAAKTIQPPRNDATEMVREALRTCAEGDSLSFATDTYHFHPERASEALVWIPNNDSGVKRIAFPVKHGRHLTIDGQGSKFVFHGAISPFLIESCHDVTIRNLTIEWNEPCSIEAFVIDATKDAIQMELPEGYRGKIVNGRLMLNDLPITGFLEIDPDTGGPAADSGDHCGAPWHSDLTWQWTGERQLILSVPYRNRPIPGNVLCLWTGIRLNPAIMVVGSGGFEVENVLVHDAPGMALVAHRSADIHLDHFDVRPSQGRFVSATADATHFVNCLGEIKIDNCTWEGQLDDAVNVHGIYAKVIEKRGQELFGQIVHPQQRGSTFATTGDEIWAINPATLERKGPFLVREAWSMNSEVGSYHLSSGEDAIDVMDVLENATWNPNVTIRSCVARHNRARGFLISTPGKVLIEDNTLGSGGSGIQISGGIDHYWYESGAVRDVTIRNNVFENCNVGPWGEACVDILPPIPDSAIAGAFHSNIRIEGNTFRTSHPLLVAARSTAELVIHGNSIERTGDTDETIAPVRIESCPNAKVDLV